MEWGGVGPICSKHAYRHIHTSMCTHTLAQILTVTDTYTHIHAHRDTELQTHMHILT